MLQSLFAAPYAFGDQLVSILADDGGNKAVDKALRHPPKSGEVLLDPEVYGTDAAEPKKVELSAPDGVDELDDGTLGALPWYLMLSRRIDPKDALAAADGWGGDHYVLYRDDGRTCLDVAYEGDTSDDVDEMHDALDEWIAAGDEGDASVETTDDGLRFHACDPGEDADTAGGDGSDDEALGIAVTPGADLRRDPRSGRDEGAGVLLRRRRARPLHDRPAARRAGRVRPERRGPDARSRTSPRPAGEPVAGQPWSASIVRPSSWVR